MALWNHNNKKAPMPRVTVIGTGTMGTAMARRLLGAGMKGRRVVAACGVDDAARGCRSNRI
jgi:pyrroline-5-carboxylate reductase